MSLASLVPTPARVTPVRAALAATLLLAGCGGGGDRTTGPDATAIFDAAAVTTASDAAQAVLTQPVFSAIFAQAMVGATHFSLSAPAPVHGATYVRDVSGYFVRDSSRTGAPANGVRYMVDRVSPAYVDVVDTTANGRAVRRVTISDGTTTVYTSTRTADFPSGPTAPLTIGDLAGTASGGGQTITFRSTVARDTTAAGTTVGVPGVSAGRLVSTITASSAGASFAATMAVPLAARDTTRTEITVGGHTLVLAVAAVPYGGPGLAVLSPLYVPSDTTRLTLDGAAAGRIIVAPAASGGVRYLRADGSPMTDAERQAIVALLRVGGSLPSVSIVALLVENWRWQVR